MKMVRPQDRDRAQDELQTCCNGGNGILDAEYDSDIIYDGLTFTKAKAASVAWLRFPQCGLNLWRCCRQTHLPGCKYGEAQVVILDARSASWTTADGVHCSFKTKVSDWSKAIKLGLGAARAVRRSSRNRYACCIRR